MILGPRKRIDNRGRHCGHQPAAPGGCAAGGRQFQHKPGRARGPGAVRGDCGGHGGGGTGGHERTLPPMVQAVVNCQMNMGHAPGRPGGALLDRLNPGHRQSSVPECGGLGRKAQHGPLPGLGVTPWSHACRTFALPSWAYTFPIRPPETPDRVDHMFAKIRRAIPRPPRRECHRQAWISPETWSLITIRIATRQHKYQWSSRALSRAINEGLQEDRRRQAAEAGSAVDSFLASDPPLIREAWI